MEEPVPVDKFSPVKNTDYEGYRRSGPEEEEELASMKRWTGRDGEEQTLQ